MSYSITRSEAQNSLQEELSVSVEQQNFPHAANSNTHNPAVTKIALVGPNELFREALGRTLDTERFRVLFSVACIHDILEKSLPEREPILLIMDVGGTDADSEFAQIGEFKVIYPGSHVVVLAHQCRPAEVVSAFRAGADGYLTRVATYETFIKALELIMLGQTVLPAETSKFIQEMSPALKDRELSILSNREKSILRCLIGGGSNKVIAREINIAEATVKVHVKAILRKIRARNRTQAAVWAVNHGALAPVSDTDSEVSSRF